MTPNDMLIAAVKGGKPRATLAALQAGGDPQLAVDGGGLLHVAARHGYAKIAALLLEYGCDPRRMNGHHFTPLHEAVAGRHYAIARMLLAAGADVNAQCNPGASQSPLHLALWCDIRDGIADRCQFLLQYGADAKCQSYLPCRGDGARGDALAQARAFGEKGEALARMIETYTASYAPVMGRASAQSRRWRL